MYRELDLTEIVHDAETFINIARLFSKEKGTALLCSGGEFPLSKKSFLALFPFETISVHADKQQKFYLGQNGIQLNENPWDGLKKFLGEEASPYDLPRWIGYLSYEMGAFVDPLLTIEHCLPEIPLAFFQRHALVLVFDHTAHACFLYQDLEAIDYLGSIESTMIRRLEDISEWKSIIFEANQTIPQDVKTELRLVDLLDDDSSYISQVLKAKELIYNGEIYQVNLSKQFMIQGSCYPFEIFDQLLFCNPAPYMGYLNFPFCTLVSSSPEQFLKKMGRHLYTEPIKGTAPRGKNHAEDQQSKQQLLTSPKENAELLMITDLMRNDLGKMSLPGSVESQTSWICHAYQNVFHLSSPLKSSVDPSMHYLDILRACFPGGSITGCPKNRAMQVINDLEKSPRGPYTGSIGYFSSNGDFDFNIAIRTVVVFEDHIRVSLGAGIVADSNPEKEFKEILHKGESIFKVLKIPSLN